MRNHRSCVHALLTTLACLAILVSSQPAAAQDKPKYATDVPQSITTPDSVETRLGTLEFKDGAPSAATVEKVYDNLDFTHALNAYMNSHQGASLYAMREGFLSIGAADNSVVIYSELMDSKSLFLTANADTVYTMSFLDLTKGPMVVETPTMALGGVDDMWFHWVIDMGLPGPDRGAGGKYLILPPDYKGERPDSGFHVGQSRTTRVWMFARFFLEKDDPKPVAERVKKQLKIYPYTPGGSGTAIASILDGTAKKPASFEPTEVPPTKFIEATGKAFNTIPANDYSVFEQLNALVQVEPATALDPELAGQMAAIGIVKGKKFNPDARMKKILTDAAAVGTATGRALNFRSPDKWAYYEGSGWSNMLFEGGYMFETPPPMVTKEGVKPFPPTGNRALDARYAFFYAYTGITPAMCMRLTGIGSQYLFTFVDAKKNYFDGARTYKLTLPKDIPAARFWSLTLYDNQTRSMLQTEQRFPRAGSQSYPTPAAVADGDGTTTVYLGPKRPEGVKEGNWIQTVPGKGWFAILRLYSPLEPFFDKSWRAGEIEELK